MENDRLSSSLTATILSLTAAQALVIGLCSLAYRLPLRSTILFLVIAVVYHALLLFVMLGLRPLFVLARDGSRLQRVNASNVLSLLRLSSLPSIVFLILSARLAHLMPVILPFLVIVFLTDFVDGRLARRLDQVTRIGRYLDAFSDYMVLGATLFVFLAYALIPWWFFVLVVVRLGVVAVGNGLLYWAHGYVEPETSYCAKASIFAIMLLFAAKILEIPYGLIFAGPSPLTVERLDALELMVAGVLIVSTFEKIGLIGRKLLGRGSEAQDRHDTPGETD